MRSADRPDGGGRRRLHGLWPSRWPGTSATAYAVGLVVALALLWSAAGRPVAVSVLAPSRPVSSAPELPPETPPWWAVVRLGGDFWVQLMRLSLPLLPAVTPLSAPPGQAPRQAPGQATGSAVGSVSPTRPLEPLLVWSPDALVDAATLLAGGFRWSRPETWLGADLPFLAFRQPPAVPPKSEQPPPTEVAAPPKGNLVVVGQDPTVLIYHTHATESFLPELPDADAPNQAFTSDRARDMVHVGDVLTTALATLGVQVVHSRTLYDANGRVGAYEHSLAGIQPLLVRYPDVRLLIDVHRDSARRTATTATVDGRTTAKVMLVVGTDRTLPQPHWKANEAFAGRVAAAVAARYPTLLRRPDGQPYLVENGRYNQQLAVGAILIEVGGVDNTMAEEVRTARLLAPVLATLLKTGAVPPRT